MRRIRELLANITEDMNLIRAIMATTVLIITTLLVSFFVTNQVEKVEIVGNSVNSDLAVKNIALDNIFAGNSVLLTKFRGEIKKPKLKFVESLKIERVSAHTIRIHVNEKQIVGFVYYLDNNLYFDKDGLVVETAVAENPGTAFPEALSAGDLSGDASGNALAYARGDISGDAKKTGIPARLLAKSVQKDHGDLSGNASTLKTREERGLLAEGEKKGKKTSSKKYALADVLYVTGLKVERMAVGKKILLANGDKLGDKESGRTIFNTLLGLDRIIKKYELVPDEVHINEDQTLYLVYGKIEVDIGKDTLLEEKITRVAAIIPKLEGKEGVLHLEDYQTGVKNIIFSETVDAAIKNKKTVD